MDLRGVFFSNRWDQVALTAPRYLPVEPTVEFTGVSPTLVFVYRVCSERSEGVERLHVMSSKYRNAEIRFYSLEKLCKHLCIGVHITQISCLKA